MWIYQSSLRANCSTDTCLPWLTGNIFSSAENENNTDIILIDLEKAFDTFRS